MKQPKINSLRDLRKRKANLNRAMQNCEDEVSSYYHNAVRIANIVRLGWKFIQDYRKMKK